MALIELEELFTRFDHLGYGPEEVQAALFDYFDTPDLDYTQEV